VSPDLLCVSKALTGGTLPLGTERLEHALPPLCVTDAECDRIALALCAAVRAGTAAS
jgi:adenosylmethionine-8-amino-7-oxononanoate aminotransferase